MFRKIKVRGDKIFSIVSLFAMLANSFAPVLAAIPTYTYAEGIAAPVEVLTKEDKEEIKVEEKIESESVLKEEKNNETKNETESQSSEEVSEENQEGDILEDGVSDYRPEVEITEDEVKEVEEVSILKETVNSVNELNDSEEVTEASASEEGPVLENKEKEYKYLEDGAVVDSTREDWDVDGKVAETKKVVKIGVKYIFPLDEDVSVTFTKLPKSEEDRARLKIERVRVEELNLPDEFKTDAEYAFDITTEGMENGEFEYDLTLPKPKDVEAKVISIEEDGDIIKVDKDDIDQKEKVVKVKDQSHFSIKVPLYITPESPSAADDISALGLLAINGEGAYTISSTSGIWTDVEGGSNITGKGTEEIRWGSPIGSQKSGLRFDGTGETSFDANQKFLIGGLTHFNWPIYSGGAASGATLKVTLNFSNPAITPSPTFTYDFGIEETKNTDRVSQCKYYGQPEQKSQTPCDDVITFPNGGYGEGVYTIGDMKYTLKIDGFQDSYPSGSEVSKFITEEKKNNKAFLVGHLSSVLVERPAISIVKKVNGQDANTPGEAVQVNAGDTVNFTYIVQNTGNVKLTNIVVADDKGVDVTCPGTELEPGTNMTCTGSATAIAGNYTNIGTVTSSHSLSATDPANYIGIVPTIRICHASGSHTNPYIVNNPSASGDLNGHAGHTGPIWTPGITVEWGDIIPPFTYYNGEQFPGVNWSEYGQAVYNNNCIIPQGKIIVNKVLSPASNSNQTFEIVGSGTPTVTGSPTFLYNSDSNIGSISRNKSHTYNVMPGTYNIAETVPAGWKEVENTCKDIVITNNETKTCTITNTQYGSLTIIKKAIPHGSDQFGFTLKEVKDGSSNIIEEFNLIDNSGTEDASKTFNLEEGTYAIAENSYNDWNTVYSCTGNNTIDNIVLNAGDLVICTFTNTKLRTISGYKYYDKDGSVTTEDDRDSIEGWEIFIDLNRNGMKDDGETRTTDSEGYYEFTNLIPGTYTVKEIYSINDWFYLETDEIEVTLTAEKDKTDVNFINVQYGSIQVLKNVDGNGDGDLDDDVDVKGSDQWNWTINGETVGKTGTTKSQLRPGRYEIKETGGLNNYHFVSLSCTGAADERINIAGDVATIQLESGENVVCTYTNARDTGTLIVRKEVKNDNGGILVAKDFSFKIDTGKGIVFNQDPTNPLLGENKLEKFPTGIYSITELEANQRGYTTSYDNCSKVEVNKGETTVCTITNDDIAPKLQLVKQVTINNGGTAVATDWNLKADGPTPISGDGGVTSGDNFKAGTYTLSETGPEGYNASAWSCTNNIAVGEGNKITLGAGQSTVCTITNDDIAPILTLVKKLITDNGGDAEVGDFTLKAGDITFTSGVSQNVNAGTYTLSESGPEGYSASAWSCVGGTQNGSNITLTEGQSATCTITNDDKPAKLTVVKRVINDNGGTATADDFNIRLNDKELKFELDPKSEDKYTSTYISNPEVQSNIKYILEEIDHSGYKEGTWSCKPKKDDGVGDARPIPTKEQVVSEQADKVPSTSLTLSPGDDIVCTITNDDLAPKLTLVKEVNNKDLPEDLRKVKEDWTITATGPTTISGDGGVTSGADFKAGTYTLSETDNIPGFTSANGWSCKGATLQEGNKITLKVGDVASCKIINESTYGKVVVEKQTTPDGSNSLFEFNPSWSETHFSLSDGQQHDSGWLVPGQYSVSEIVPTGWELTDIVCNDNNSGSSAAAGNTANINLDANETVTCTFTNTQRPVTIVATKVVCDYEKDLPNYGYGAPVNITENTASDWIASHPSCRLEPDWSFQWGDDWDTNPSDSFVGEVAGWNTFGPTDIDGVATVKIKDFGTTSQIKVREVLKANYFPFTYLTNGSTNKDDVSAEIYCDVDVLNYDNDDRITPEYGNTYYCVAWNVEKNPALSIDKTAKQSTYNEVGDVINYSFVVTNTGNVSLNGPVTIDDDKTTDETCPAVNTVGNSDDKLDPGESITCTASYTITQTDLDTGSVTNVASASVGGTTSPTDTVKVDAVPTLSISKSNDSYPTAEKIGNQVKFTIEVTAHRNDVSEVEVYDLFSKGFKYIEGSWTAFSSSRGDIVVPEPTYASPAVWDLGYMEKDETITLTYLAEITDSVTAGIYKDLAWTQGSSELSADGILGYAEETGYVNDSFVGTKVLVEVDPSELKDKVSVKEKKIEGEVLGAATLPATGSRTLWVNIVLALSAVGGTLMILGSLLDKNSNKKGSKKGVKKSLIGLLVLSLFIALSRGVYAAPTVVRISEPTTPAKDEFNLVFVVMDIQNREIAAKCFYKFEDSSYSQFGSDITIPSGKSGDSRTCFVDKNVLDSDGKYIFKVEATVEGTTVSSEEVSVDYDSDGPGKPEYIKKEKVNDCVNKITLKTSDDGETKYVKVYADDGKEIHIKDSNLIETEDLGPGKKFSFEHIVSGDACKKDWYYAVVAFDSAGNASNPRSETVTKVIETAPGTEEEVVEAIPVVGGAGIAEEGGAVAGDQEVAKAEGEGQGATEEGGSAIEGNEEEGSVLGEKTEKKSVFRSPWLWLVLVGLGIIIVSGVKKGKKN